MDGVAYLVELSFGALLLLAALVAGRLVEAAHFRRLAMRERELADILVSGQRWLPPNWQASEPRLVTGSVVIANDYFKVFAAGIRKIFGGRIRSFETLVERARREAVVRMLDEARAAGANAVWNVRIETASLGGEQARSGIEAIAYGTALRIQ